MRRFSSCLSILALIVGVVVLPTPDAAVAQIQFSDTAGNTHEENIQRLADREITFGCGGGRFCPDAPVSRQEMATFLARALQLPTTSGASRFNDVTSSAHGPNIEALADAGITAGVRSGYRCTVPTHGPDEPQPEDPRFCPLDPVSRNQMAVFLERAFEIETARPVGLDDVDPDSFHAPAIGAALSSGITKGCSPGDRYCGSNDVKRSQMASFLMRALDVVERSTACPAEPTQPDQVLDVATQGFPVNSAVADRDADRLYLFTNGLTPQRLVVARLSDGEVLRNIAVPGGGSRVWARTIAGGHLYFGRWGMGPSGHSFYRVALTDLAGGGDPNFQTIGMEGLGGSTPLDDRIRSTDHQGNVVVTPNREFWTLTSDAEGRVYAGTGRQDTVYRFTPPELTGDATGSIETARLKKADGSDLPAPPENSRREVTALAWTPSGLVVGTGRGQGIARIVDASTMDPAEPVDPIAPEPDDGTRTWPSRGIDLGNGSQNLFAIYDATVRQPTTASAGRVLLTTEEERARLVGIEVPILPLGDEAPLPLPSEPETVHHAPVDEPILHAPSFAPNGNPVTVGNSTTRLYEDDSSALVQRGMPVPASVTRMMVTVGGASGEELVGVTANGTIWRRTSTTSATTTLPLEWSELIDPGPERPQSLTAARNGDGPYAIVGGNNKVTVHALPDPGSSVARRAPHDVTMPGEAKTVLAVGSTVYAATYPGGELRRFTIGEGGIASTGSLVVSWSDGYNRPRDMAYDAKNGRLVIGVKSDFEGFGAIISVKRDGSGLREWNTGSFLTPTQLASQEPLTVAVAPDGTAIIGTPNGFVTGFDHVNGRKLWEVRPTQGSVRGLTVTADGVVHGLTTSGTRFSIVDGPRGVATTSPYPTTGASLLTGTAAGSAGQLTQVDGQLVAATARRLVAIDPGTGAEELLSEGTAPSTFTSRAHAAAVPGSGCQDVLTFRSNGTTTAARVARAPVARPLP